MIRLFFLILCMLLFFSIFKGQTYSNVLSVDYWGIVNTKEQNCRLLIESNRSLFTIKRKTTQNKGTSLEESVNEKGERQVNIDINSSDTTGSQCFLDLRKRHILETHQVFVDGAYKSYIVLDTLLNINWRLIDEFKKIGEFECQKAMGDFRGRSYTAWFTSQIPISIGPWKLHGLPGLIVEVYDLQKYIYYGLRKIESLRADSVKVSPPAGMKTIPIREYVSMYRNTGKNFQKHIQSKLPRGTTINISNVIYNAPELIYEFENQ